LDLQATQTPRLHPRLIEAVTYVDQMHATQVRKVTGVPYIAHLLIVAGLVLEDGGSEEEAIAALLHDVVEDQSEKGASREVICHRFGEMVASIVDGCTDIDTIPKLPWRERKELYLRRLREASPQVRRVSVADKLHNARALLLEYREHGETLWETFSGGKEGVRSFVVVSAMDGSMLSACIETR